MRKARNSGGAPRLRPLQEIKSLVDDACAAAFRPSNRDLISLNGLSGGERAATPLLLKEKNHD